MFRARPALLKQINPKFTPDQITQILNFDRQRRRPIRRIGHDYPRLNVFAALTKRGFSSSTIHSSATIHRHRLASDLHQGQAALNNLKADSGPSGLLGVQTHDDRQGDGKDRRRGAITAQLFRRESLICGGSAGGQPWPDPHVDGGDVLRRRSSPTTLANPYGLRVVGATTVVSASGGGGVGNPAFSSAATIGGRMTPAAGMCCWGRCRRRCLRDDCSTNECIMWAWQQVRTIAVRPDKPLTRRTWRGNLVQTGASAVWHRVINRER